MCDTIDAYCTMLEAEGQSSCRSCIETLSIRKYYGLDELDHVGEDAEEYLCLLEQAEEEGEDFPSFLEWLNP